MGTAKRSVRNPFRGHGNASDSGSKAKSRNGRITNLRERITRMLGKKQRRKASQKGTRTPTKGTPAALQTLSSELLRKKATKPRIVYLDLPTLSNDAGKARAEAPTYIPVPPGKKLMKTVQQQGITEIRDGGGYLQSVIALEGMVIMMTGKSRVSVNYMRGEVLLKIDENETRIRCRGPGLDPARVKIGLYIHGCVRLFINGLVVADSPVSVGKGIWVVYGLVSLCEFWKLEKVKEQSFCRKTLK